MLLYKKLEVNVNYIGWDLMKKIYFIIAAALACVGIAACASDSGTKPFEGLTADEVVSVSVNCTPPDKTAETDDEEKIAELVKLLNKQTVYGEDEKEYAGQSVEFILHRTDGTDIKINAYNPQLIIDGVRYTAKSEPCEELSELGNTWIEELPQEHRPIEEIRAILASYPADYENIIKTDCYVISNIEEITNQELYDEFVKNVSEGIADEITIVRFTAEGDPIYKYISYNGEDFYCVEDVSRDEFKGNGDNYIEYTYKYLVNITDPGGPYAYLANDENVISYEQITSDESIDCLWLF